jgi:hypothetical protein
MSTSRPLATVLQHESSRLWTRTAPRHSLAQRTSTVAIVYTPVRGRRVEHRATIDADAKVVRWHP